MSFFEFPHTRTYNSDLGWLIKEVTRIADQYDTFIEYMNTHKVEYEELLKRVTALETEINTFEAEIDTRFNQLKNQLENEIYTQIQTAIANLQAQLGTIYKDLEDLRAEVKRNYLDQHGYSDALYKLSLDYTDLKIQELIDSIPDLTTVNVFNPVRGEITTIQVAIDDLYDIGRPDCLTALEYDDLQLTALEFDSLNMTAIEYDLYSKKLLEEAGIFKNPAHFMYSPFTGEYVPLQTVILELSYLHQSDTLTAEEYDQKDLAAEDYDLLELTAYDYDWHGKSLIS